MCSTLLNPNDSAVVSRVDETANSSVLGKGRTLVVDKIKLGDFVSYYARYRGGDLVSYYAGYRGGGLVYYYAGYRGGDLVSYYAGYRGGDLVSY